MVVYFAYGSNMDPHQMAKRVPDAEAIGTGRLNGFELAFNIYSTRWGGGAANLVPAADAHVWGALWEIPEQAWTGLDAYEGHPTFYRREQVVVERGEESIIAWTYRVAHQQAYIRPTDEYLQRVRSAIRVHGLPPEALDILERAARPPRPTIST
jgi:gamma-glutamylcyclotransferase (GGCT)/AIG2-like uncharacterized protein YtfP